MNKIKLLKASVLGFFVLSVVLSISISRVTAFWPFPSYPTIYSCDGGGDGKNEFGLAEDVYACGDNYNSGESVTIYVVPKGGPYNSGSSIYDASATTDASGSLSPVNLGTFALGEYDIWVDLNSNGYRDWWSTPEPVDTFGSCRAGFFVIPEFWLGTILGLVGCFAAFGVFLVTKRQ